MSSNAVEIFNDMLKTPNISRYYRKVTGSLIQTKHSDFEQLVFDIYPKKLDVDRFYVCSLDNRSYVTGSRVFMLNDTLRQNFKKLMLGYILPNDFAIMFIGGENFSPVIITLRFNVSKEGKALFVESIFYEKVFGDTYPMDTDIEQMVDRGYHIYTNMHTAITPANLPRFVKEINFIVSGKTEPNIKSLNTNRVKELELIFGTLTDKKSVVSKESKPKTEVKEPEPVEEIGDDVLGTSDEERADRWARKMEAQMQKKESSSGTVVVKNSGEKLKIDKKLTSVNTELVGSKPAKKAEKPKKKAKVVKINDVATKEVKPKSKKVKEA